MLTAGFFAEEYERQPAYFAGALHEVFHSLNASYAEMHAAKSLVHQGLCCDYKIVKLENKNVVSTRTVLKVTTQNLL